MAFALRAVRRRDTAQDLVQETFVAAIENQASFQGRSQLRTWLVGILGRKIADYFRKNGREVPTETLPEPTAPSRLAPQHADRQDVRLDHRRAVGVVERAMGRLSELERTAVLLCDVEQMSRAEAAGVMDVRPPHLRVLLHRGRHKLRRALERAELGQAQVPT
jgi:RNA polymerase sigma-70 factor (ECF subfamily)